MIYEIIHLIDNSPFYLSQNLVENSNAYKMNFSNLLSPATNSGIPFSNTKLILLKCSYNFKTVHSIRLHNWIFISNNVISYRGYLIYEII